VTDSAASGSGDSGRGRAVATVSGGEVHLWLYPRSDSETLARTTLSRYVDILPERWEFEREARGRPRQINLPGRLDFNLTHCRDRCAIAVTSGARVGVDLEYCNTGRDYMRLARHYFHPAELGALESLKGHEQCRRFYALWTLKEAHIKARGEALPSALSGTCFEIDPEGEVARLEPAGEGDSRYWLFEIAPGWMLAVNCLEAGDSPARLRVFGTPSAGAFEPPEQPAQQIDG